MTPGAAPGRQTEALQALLIAEHAAIYGLATAGGRLSALGVNPATVATVADTFDQHRLRRDTLVAALTAAHADVPAALPAYAVPALPSAQAALQFLGTLSERTAAAYREQLAPLQTESYRRLAVTAVVAAARFHTAMLTAAGKNPAAASMALPGS
ncbi:MAG TPA: DUF4439 domain-containing protein [Mycobacteriales bacterium]|jgi:hypothetical protein|nr:DUF4439 domain-containing protein [Mycobacteriales bacterium]